MVQYARPNLPTKDLSALGLNYLQLLKACMVFLRDREHSLEGTGHRNRLSASWNATQWLTVNQSIKIWEGS